MKTETIYKDNLVSIKQKKNTIQCVWIINEVINQSYMIAKLTEVVSNKYPGSWPVNTLEEASKFRGMRCFICIWKNKKVLTASWI